MKIVIFGAGSIGMYIGGALLAAGADVLLIGRARMREKLLRHGLQLTDLHGGQLRLEGARVPFTDDPSRLAEADLILLAVKSADTGDAADAIARHGRPQALLVSLQNGIGNTELLRTRLPGRTVLAGMVPFNVVQMPDGRFHRGTEGELTVEASPRIAEWEAIFARAGLPLQQRADIVEVQWGKLLLNLNNPVNALSGLPLRDELSQRAWRRCLALLIEEALRVLRSAGIRPARVARVAPSLLPPLLRLPDPLFRRVAGAMLRIDPEARSSMWEDLQAGRRTEVEYLNGAVVALAQASGGQAPANRRIVQLITAAPPGQPPVFSGDALYRALSPDGIEASPQRSRA